MSLFHLINMSDRYYFEAPDVKIAALVVLLSAGTSCGAEEVVNKTNSTPILSGWEPWLKEQGIVKNDFKTDFDAYIQSRKQELIDSLESVLIGNLDFRQVYKDATKSMSREELIAYRDTWHDKKRSSLNDIGGRAYATASKLRG